LLNNLQRILKRYYGSRQFTLLLLIIVEPSGSIRGEGRINAHVIPEILSSLQNLKWPRAKDRYIYKQYFIFDLKST
jgi:hypothetical protein